MSDDAKPKRVRVLFTKQPELEIDAEHYEAIETDAEARVSRIIATARRIFEATAAVEYMDSQIRSALACAEAFEDAADKYRNGVKS